MKHKLTTTVLTACLALALMAGAAHALTFDFQTDSLGNAIAPGEVIDYEYQNDGLTVYTYNNATPAQSMGIAYDAGSTRGLAVSDLNSPVSPESAGGHFIFAFDQTYNSGSFEFDLGGGAGQVQFVLGGALVGLADLVSPSLVFSDVLGSGVEFDTLAFVLSTGGYVEGLSVDYTLGATSTATTPEPITATLGLMGIAALSSTVLGRRRNA